MDRDDYADMFRFRIGDCVRWAEAPRDQYYIAQRRWTQRKILPPVVEYRLEISKESRTGGMSWVFEHDVEAWGEEA